LLEEKGWRNEDLAVCQHLGQYAQSSGLSPAAGAKNQGNRCHNANVHTLNKKANDHDMGPEAKLMPVGILEVVTGFP